MSFLSTLAKIIRKASGGDVKSPSNLLQPGYDKDTVRKTALQNQPKEDHKAFVDDDTE